MPGVFAKLNLGSQREIFVLNAPPSFAGALSGLDGVHVRRRLGKADRIAYALAFVTRQAQLDRLARSLTAAASGDALLWFAYPKATSRRYRCEFNRDSGFAALHAAGFDSVRIVAIDEDWSALRFRRLEYIGR
jgi:hypothetical protein